MTYHVTPGRYKPPDFSDAGNAEVFCFYHQHDLIYTDALGWLWWNGMVWERGDHKALALAKELAGKMLAESERELKEALADLAQAKLNKVMDKATSSTEASDTKRNVSEATEYANHAKATRNALRLKNMLELSKPDLIVPLDQLDADRSIMNTTAGIVDLTTGKIRPHDPAAYCTMITTCGPGDQGRELWEAHLSEVTEDDGSKEGFLQMSTGADAYGKVYNEGIKIAVGGGKNGKSTTFNAIQYVLGDYAGSIDVKVLTTDKTNQGASLATLRGKRLVVTGELEEHQRLSVAMLKKLASTDRLVIEEKYRQPETVTPSHSLVLFTNHLPRVGSTDNGTWRRLTVIPFTATIEPKKEVANYAEVLAQKAGPAILKWIIEGAIMFARNGYKLAIPESVAEATAEYREREDWLTNFINERCVREPGASVGGAALYGAYKEWAEDTGDYVRRLSDFNTALESAGYRSTHPKNKKTWHGLRIDYAATYGYERPAAV